MRPPFINHCAQRSASRSTRRRVRDVVAVRRVGEEPSGCAEHVRRDRCRYRRDLAGIQDICEDTRSIVARRRTLVAGSNRRARMPASKRVVAINAART